MVTGTLFDVICRDYQGPAERSESRFEYLNRSARPTSERIRALLETWFVALPEQVKPDLRARLRSGNRGFHSAFFELYIHALFTQLGFELEAHPELGGETTHPDYLARREGQPVFYLEAIVPSRPDDEMAERARIGQVYAALDRMNSPNFFLGITSVSGSPPDSPSARGLRRPLERWLTGLDPDAVAGDYQSTGARPILRACYVLPGTGGRSGVWWITSCRGRSSSQAHGGLPGPLRVHTSEPPRQERVWELAFEAIPKKPEARGKSGVRPVGAVMSQVEPVNTEGRLRSAILQKATKYGVLELPFVIAVNLVDENDYVGPEDWIDLQNALLGSEELRHASDGVRIIRETYDREANGVWWGPHGSRNTQVSGLLLALHLFPCSVARTAPLLIHHRGALRPFPDGLWPLSQAILDLSRPWEELVVTPGTVVSPFGLPEGWPRAP